MIPVLDGSGAPGKSVLEGAELQTALTAIVTAINNLLSGTQPVSLTAQPLPTGAATAAKQDTLQTAINTLNTVVADTTPAAVTIAQLPASIGPKTAATSLSMAFATDATQPLPTGAATAAKQDTLAAVNATIGTRAYGTPSGRLTVGASDSASTGLAATEVLLHASTRCFVLAGAAATNAAIPLEAGEKFHMRLTSGQQIHVIQDTAGGFLNVIPVA